MIISGNQLLTRLIYMRLIASWITVSLQMDLATVSHSLGWPRRDSEFDEWIPETDIPAPDLITAYWSSTPSSTNPPPADVHPPDCLLIWFLIWPCPSDLMFPVIVFPPLYFRTSLSIFLSFSSTIRPATVISTLRRGYCYGLGKP